MESREDLFEDMASALESWLKVTLLALSDSGADLAWTDSEPSFHRVREGLVASEVDEADMSSVLSETLRGLAISFLTILDGGTKLTEKGRVYLVDEAGSRLGNGLHDDFVSYLIDSGRLD